MPWSREDLTRLVELEAHQQGVDPRLAVALAQQESNFDPAARSPKGAYGIMQLMPGTAKQLGVNAQDPADNIRGGVTYLKQQLDAFGGDQAKAIAAYNAGPGVVQAYKGVPPYKETRGLVSRVMGSLGPSSAEAATPQAPLLAQAQTQPQASGMSRLQELEAHLARLEGQAAPQPQQAPAASPMPPTATSTPEQDAAYRASRGQQPTPPVSQTSPTPQTPSRPQEMPQTPDTAWTPGMRFQALPSITQLEPAERTQRTQEFARLTPALQEEFLRSEEPASDLTVDIEKPSPPQAGAATGGEPARPSAPPGPVRPAGLTRLTPDMNDDAILRTLGYDPAVVKQSRFYKPGMYQKQIPKEDRPTAAMEDSPLGGFGRGVQEFGEGAAQTLLRGAGKIGLLGPAELAQVDALTKLHEAVYQQNIRKGAKVDPETGEPGILSDPARLVGNLVAAPIPAGKAAGWIPTIARGAVTGAIAGATQPVTNPSPQPGSETDDFWTQKGWQTGTGGVLGGVLGPGIEKGVMPAVNRGVNWARGVINPAYQKIIELGDRFGVRLSAPEISGSPFGQKIETGLEAVPGTGYGTFRRTEQQQVRGAAETLKTGLEQDVQATAWRDLAAVEQAARGTGQRAKEARFLLDEINDAGNDWGRVVQTSGKLNLFNDRVRAGKLYDTVTELAAPLGNMRLPQTTKAIDDAIARANADVLPSPEVKREVLGALGRVRAEINPTESVRPSMGVHDPVTGTLRAQPMTPTTSVPDTTYGRMRGLRSSLGDLQREAAEPAVARYLGGVKSALEEDMHAFATRSNVPQLSKAAKDADTFYKTRVVKYREGQLAKSIEKDLPDEIYNQFVRRGKDRAQYFYNGLDPKGQAAVRYGMVEEAFDKAMSGPNPEIFSPQRFASAMHKIQEASGVFFKGVPQWEIDGFTKLMQHTPRAGQYMENPPTGWRTGVLALLFNPWLYLQAVGAGQGVKQLFTSKAGRSLMLAANDLQPGSPALQRAWNQFARQVPRAAAIRGAGQADQPSQPQR